ncbi:uncharacterized protein [Phaseolus vulgaris]|uniref:MYND-type domain-containing protein n=1 Tax=Phaseolus vulgaris TaxID=3885 RepID=V7AIL0_PHAVU|nr:hypothetical protein PHAVU_011G179600g [Phaseolus vulgaris]ESW05442.1 hypothetical protein PHAVU_011G179600g [Phaseolus vulgaris]
MPAYGASFDLKWLLGLLGLGEKGAPISDDNSIKTWLQILLLTLVIGILWILYELTDDRENNHNVNEVDELEEMDHPTHELDHFYESQQREQEHPNGELDHHFDEEDSHRATVSGGNDGRRHRGCAFCGNSSTTRCSRCKAVRYCSVKCQIMHWRSRHRYECCESEIAADEEQRTEDETTSNLVESSEMESSHVEDGALWTSESDMAMEVSSNLHSCKVCGSPSTTRCPRCKAIQYCSMKCLIMDWKWHKVDCIARVDLTPKERPKDVGMLQNSYEEEDNVKSSGPLSLECHPGSTSLKSPIEASQSECADLKKLLQEEQKRVQNLTMECGKSQEAAKMAMKEVEAVRQEIQEKREHSQHLKENFRRDLIFAESRATIAEEKLSELYKKIRMSDYKLCSICLSNDNDLAFGCGHMTCRDCGSKLSRCPICRELITNHIKLFPG